MHRTLILAGLVLVLAVVNVGIAGNERVLRGGRLVLLELAPVDPRSLMQGDYMALRFEAARSARVDLPDSEFVDGQLILKLDEDGVGHYARMSTGARDTGAIAPDEVTVRFRVRQGRFRFATDAYFFQEGQAERFERARFGGFMIDDSGKALLADMYDEDRVLIPRQWPLR